MTMRRLAAIAASSILLPAYAVGAAGQSTGFEWGGLPAINFDSDEGFGYGAIAEAYQYGSPEQRPYAWTLQPKVFLTTKGRRDVYAFFDAPYLLNGGWRLNAFVGTEKQIATPFYGIGNESVYDETLDAADGPNPSFYRFGRTRNSATFALQRDLGTSPIRVLLGAGIERTSVASVPDDSFTTLFAQDVFDGEETYWSNYVRGGFVYDTRDRETGPTTGSWTELLVQWTDETLGADSNFTRWTFTDRRYLTLVDGLVLAHRVVVQNSTSGTPAHELSRLQSSFKQQEGLGGSKTIRGLAKNRYAGRGMFVWNAELRWRVLDFRMMDRGFHLVLSSYLDQGRVWRDGVALGEVLSDLHAGYGGGFRIGMGENFVVSADVGTSSGRGAAFYLGLGYLY